MAYIGMRRPVMAPITAETEGSAISYGTGSVIGKAVSANLTFDVADNPDYGDDVIVNNDKGVNGYSITLETTDLTPAARAALLGWTAVTSGTTDPVITHYQVSDDNPPLIGFGFIRVKMDDSGARKYEAFWFHKTQFQSSAENASTKKKQIEWNHPQVTATGMGVYIDSSGKAKYFDYMEFATEAAAETWLNTKAGIT